MRTIVIPDIHTNHDWIEGMLAKTEHDEVVFLGDYFDHWYDSPEQNRRTAEWLKDSLTKPNRVHLMGNHDMPYRFPKNRHVYCSGNRPDKSEAINSVMTREDWNKLKLAHVSQGFVMSHAGAHRSLFEHPLRGITEKEILDRCDIALRQVEMGMQPKEVGAGYARGGNQPFGGITWLDYRAEFQPIHGINQIFGHTIGDEVRVRKNQWTENYCIDTKGTSYLIISDGNVIIKTRQNEQS